MAIFKRSKTSEQEPVHFASVHVNVLGGGMAVARYDIRTGPEAAHDQARIFAPVAAYCHFLAFTLQQGADGSPPVLLQDILVANKIADAAETWQEVTLMPDEWQSVVLDHPVALEGNLFVFPDSRPISHWQIDSKSENVNDGTRMALLTLYEQSLRTTDDDYSSSVLLTAMGMLPWALKSELESFSSAAGGQEVAGRLVHAAIEIIADAASS